MFGGDFGNGEKKIFFFLHKVQKPSKVFFFSPSLFFNALAVFEGLDTS